MTLKGKEKNSWQKKWSGHGWTGRTADYGPAKVWQKHDLDDDRTTTAIHAARHC